MRKIMEGGTVREGDVCVLTTTGEWISILVAGQSISFPASSLTDVMNGLQRIQTDIQAEYTAETASDVPYLNALFTQLAKGA